MAEAPISTQGLPRTHPLDARPDLEALTAGHVTVRPDVTMVLVRARSSAQGPGPAADALAAELGAALPDRPGSWVGTEAGKVIWLGPDEWLVLAPGAVPWELESGLRAAAAPLGGAAVDVSAQRVCLRLHGPHARDLLAAGCSLDTHPAVFGAGSAAQVQLGQAGVVLVALDDVGEDYEVLVRSSFARYLADWLADAALELR